MMLYSGISVMMALLAFATLIGLTNGLTCYHCDHLTIDGKKTPGRGADCKGDSPGTLEKADSGEVCFKTHMSGTKDGKSLYMEKRGSGRPGAYPPAGDCSKGELSEGGTTQKGVTCSCNDKDACNGVTGFGSDVNVILGFGVIALILGYLRQ